MSNKIRLLKNKVLVTELEFGMKKTAAGIIIPDDDGKQHGIRSRWARVYDVGSNVTDVKKGDYVLLKHGRWTRTFEFDTWDEGKIKLNMIDYPDAVLVVTDTRPSDLNNVYKNVAEMKNNG